MKCIGTGQSDEFIFAVSGEDEERAGSYINRTSTDDDGDKTETFEMDDNLEGGSNSTINGTNETSSSFRIFQQKLRTFMEHFMFRMFGMLLIVTDILIVIIELIYFNQPTSLLQPYETISLCLVSYFVLEIFFRILALGCSNFFCKWYNTVDFVIVMCTFIVNILYTLVDLIYLPGEIKLVVGGRLVRIVVIIRLYTEKKQVEKGARHMVSQNKRRFQDDGFDLDLTYITERVIAMSFPSTGKMSIYRNPIKEVARFFNTRHPNHYKVYNLCSERTYDSSYFQNRVEHFPIDDHNVPALIDALKFIENVRRWLTQDSSNIIAVHCKGGKGRTGTMICIWLVESGLFESAKDSLSYFGNRRTDLRIGTKFQGVETPSQNRYVEYYEYIKDHLSGCLPPQVPLTVRCIKISSIAGLGNGDGSDFSLEIFDRRKKKLFDCDFKTNRNCETHFSAADDCLFVTLYDSPVLIEDVKFKFYSSSKIVPKGYENVPFFFWFHTAFIENKRLLLKRNELDNLHKFKMWQQFKERFSLELLFSAPDENCFQ